MKKRLYCFIIAFLFFAGMSGCGSDGKPTPDFDEPMQVRQKDTLDIGRVQIVNGGYWALPDFVDEDRSKQILELVGESIKQQRNIIMDLQMIRTDNFNNFIITKAASGDPPEILVRVANDRSKQRMPNPIRLNESIEQYGPNLVKIPEQCWVLSKIGDSIVSIPSVGIQFRTIAANKHALDQYGWQAPVSANEFTELLEKAKAAGMRPVENFYVGLFWDWFGIQSRTEYPNFMLIKNSENNLYPIFESPEYQQYLLVMRDWADKGYITGDGGEDGNWLFTGMDSNTLASLPNITAVMPMSMTSSGPVTVPSLQIKYCFESLNKPEALVTLLDWVYGSSENHTLIAMGEEGKDYEVAGDLGYKLIDKRKWEFQEYLSMNGFLGERIRDCLNPEAIRLAETNNTDYAKPDIYCSLPPATWRYTLPESNLLKAWDTHKSYLLAMDDAAYQYIEGLITREDYDKIVAENRPLIESCIKLVNEYMEKTYDPLSDMYTPAQPLLTE